MEGVVEGRVRVDRRTKNLCRRLRAGEIAVIDHADLDAAAAYALVECRPAAVLNAAESVTGRYPNGGPAIVLEAGIPLIDACGADLLTAVSEGQRVQLRGGEIAVQERVVAQGTPLTPASLEAKLEAARGNLGQELEAFARNTLEYLQSEKDVVFVDLPMPPLKVSFKNRGVLVVVRGPGFKQDLQWVLPYIREQRPVIVAVDGGADALLEAGIKPHVIIGDMDSASDGALRSGAELVVHTYADGRSSPGLERVKELGLSAYSLPAVGTSEDVAMLLAHQAGASLIAVVGTHFSLIEFLDKRRLGMASTFLTRLRVGSILVDAKGLSRLYRPGMSPTLVAGMVISAMLPILVVVLNSAGLQRWLGLLGMSIEVWLRRHGLR